MLFGSASGDDLPLQICFKSVQELKSVLVTVSNSDIVLKT